MALFELETGIWRPAIDDRSRNLQDVTTPKGPDYSGSTIGNLAAELEIRLTRSSLLPGLHPHLTPVVPSAEGYVVFLIDGLGSAQLDHPAAGKLADDHRADLDAPFPATTTVSLATLATATAPARHGLVAYLMHLPEHGLVNTIKWITPGPGQPVRIDADTFLPEPNLWERLTAAGIEPVVVQPGHFEGSPLTRVLYRGCRFEPYWTSDELPRAVTQLARPGRLVVAYFPSVDFHAHVSGQRSDEYHGAIVTAASTWDRLSRDLDERVGLLATGDHGHIDIAPGGKLRMSSKGLTVFGDPRALFLRGDEEKIRARLAHAAGQLVPIESARSWWGPGPDHPELAGRLPDWVFLPERGSVTIPGFMDDRMVGYHGGLEPAEAKVPLIVR